MKLLKEFRDNIGFSVPMILFVLLGAVGLLLLEKGDGVLFFNSYRPNFLSLYFSIATLLAEWQVLLLIAAILIWRNYRLAIIFVITWLGSGSIAQFFKRIVFDNVRPASYFQDITPLNFLANTDIHYFNSFPSGHTTTAFAIFTMLAFTTKNKFIQLLFFGMALSVGFSRIYLLLHFFEDVYAGAILGFIIGSVIFISLNKGERFGLHKLDNQSLSQYVKKR